METVLETAPKICGTRNFKCLISVSSNEDQSGPQLGWAWDSLPFLRF